MALVKKQRGVTVTTLTKLKAFPSQSLPLLSVAHLIPVVFLARAHLDTASQLAFDAMPEHERRRFTYDLLKNANIASGGILPMCQDTGTATVVAKKGQRVWTGADDAELLARGVFETWALRVAWYLPLVLDTSRRLSQPMNAPSTILNDKKF